ncbi:26088_t:CDS:2, partial [Gigaspora margarita]
MVHSQSTSVEEVIQQHQKFLHCLNNHFAPGIDWYGISQDPEKMHSYPSVNLLCLFNSGFTYSTLRTGSFVVKNDQTVALRDFLCAIDSKQSHVFKYYFVPYMGSEFLKEGKITKECNIYTFGLIMYRFSAPFMQELKDLNLAPESTPKSYTTLMRQCLNNDPKLRPSMTQICNKLGELYLEVERNICSPITTEFRIADEFRQMSRIEFDNKLNESDTISPNDKDISTSSLLSTISNLGVDLIDIDQFANRQYIGGGGFSSIEKALWRRTNRHVILKRIKNIAAINHKERKAFIHELKIHSQLDCIDRIVRMLGVTQSEEKFFMVMQYANDGDLVNFLKTNFSKLEWSDKFRIAFEIAEGLSFLHRENVVYRDLHSGNILIHEKHAKITDFGISRQINTDTTIHHGIFGRIPYIEPRLLRQLDYPYDKRSDIYSFGVLMWEISSGR